jgi:DNA-binding XRE family transcriptional regulator
MVAKFYRPELTHARILAGLDRGQLAEIVGISRHFVVEVENGHRDPGYQTMMKWAAALGEHGSLALFGKLRPKSERSTKAAATGVA